MFLFYYAEVDYINNFYIYIFLFDFLSIGGGYTLRNVPRCWTYETAIAVNEELANGMIDCLFRTARK
jgi:histone deacetylase 1/2